MFEVEQKILKDCYDSLRSILTQTENSHSIFNDTFIVKAEHTKNIKDIVIKAIVSIKEDIFNALDVVESILERENDDAAGY